MVKLPTPLDKIIALTLLVKTRKIDWNGVFNAVAVDINPDSFTDKEILIPQVLGIRIADGIMAVQAKDAELLGKAASDIENWMHAETWMKADEAKARGFVDRITDDENQPVDASEFTLLAKFKNTPKALLKAASSTNAMLARMEMRLANYSSASAAK